MWPREIMPQFVQKIGDFMPTTWFLKAGETILFGEGILSAVNEIVYMLVLSTLLLTISAVIKTEKAR